MKYVLPLAQVVANARLLRVPNYLTRKEELPYFRSWSLGK
jgi:hypothetical protein